MIAFQIIFAPVCLWLALRVLGQVRGGRLPPRQGIFWGGVWLCAATAVLLPQSASLLASWLGIGRGSDLVTYIAILGGLAACLFFYNLHRHVENTLTELVRREAIRSARQGIDVR